MKTLASRTTSVNSMNDRIATAELMVHECSSDSWTGGAGDCDALEFSLEVLDSTSSFCLSPDDAGAASNNNHNSIFDVTKGSKILKATTTSLCKENERDQHFSSPSNARSPASPQVVLEKENQQQQQQQKHRHGVGSGSSPGLTREFLQAAASVSFRHRSELLKCSGTSSNSNSSISTAQAYEMRTTVSSPTAGTGTTINFPLRERLRRISRSQRKELLVQADLSRSPMFQRSNSCDKDHHQIHQQTPKQHPEHRHPNSSTAKSSCDDGEDKKDDEEDLELDLYSNDTRDSCISESSSFETTEDNIVSSTTTSLSSTPPPPPPPTSSQQKEVSTSFPSLSVTEHPMSLTSWTTGTIPYDEEMTDLINFQNASKQGAGVGSAGEGVWVLPSGRPNDIKLHIYDLIAKDTLMQLPWGCVWEIGKCFNEVNTALHELGTGAYHVGIEINGIEYAYGATSTPGRSGVFSCIPKLSPGYQYRTTIDYGKRPMIRKTWVLVQKHEENAAGKPSTSFQQKIEYVDGREIVKSMASEYMGVDYDILRRNCCTFARDACLRLGIAEREIPSWFRNLAESGAMTQDLARATALPIAMVASVLSSDAPTSVLTDSDSVEGNSHIEDEEEGGFEIIARRHVSGMKDLLVVMAATPRTGSEITCDANNHNSFRRMATWAY